MGDGWTGETFATFVAAVIGAVVGVVSVAATVLEARASRRNTETLAQRSAWWERWSWIAERAFSPRPGEEQAATIMLRQVTHLPWTTAEDRRTALAISSALTPKPEHDDRRDDR